MSNNNGRWEFDENGNVRYVEDQPTTDGAYRYSYRDTKPREPQVNQAPRQTPQRQTPKDDTWHWVLIVLAFVAAWPIGLVLLFLQILGKWPSSKTLNQEARRVGDAARKAASQFTDGTRSTARSAESQSAWQPRQAQPGNYGQTTAQVQERLARERAQQAEARARAQAEQQAREAQFQQRRQQELQQKEALRQKKKAQRDEGLAHGLGHVRLFRWIGGVMAGLFGFAFITELIDQIASFASVRSLLSDTLPLLALALIGVTLIAVAGVRHRKLKRFKKYLTMIGSRDRVSLTTLAEAMGMNEYDVEKDLNEMFQRDFWEKGYVDAGRRMLVLSEGLEDPAPQPAAEPKAGEGEDESTAAATLRRIREVNDAIPDPQMTAKIARIEELTAKIFQLLEERPEKAADLRTFMNYYLPQTLKILENYAKLDAQGIQGENIAEAKEKIEGMMDKLVDGYETQLDKLFEDDVMDISADLQVMEQMLEKDGLAVEQELRL